MRWAVALALAGCASHDEICAIDGNMCTHLSSWHLFDDDLVPYDLNTPLFSDYATKKRFVRLPPGATVPWNDLDALALPIGSVLVKTFSYLHDRRDPSLGETLLETRVLVHGETGWHGGSYVYGDDDGDAELAIAGATIDASWIHDDGSQRTNRYFVPNMNQCKECHAEHDDIVTPLGPKVRHLQPERMQAMIDLGLLTDAPPREQWPAPIAAMDPASGSLDERAREWLDINCSYCHNETGAARTSGLFLTFSEADPARWGICKPPVATGRGSGGLAYDIVPGQPDQSILLYRISSTDPEIRMPELGRNLVYDEGVALIREWIAAMAGSCTLAVR